MAIIQSLAVIASSTDRASRNYSAGVNDVRGEFFRILAARDAVTTALRRSFIDTALRLFDKRLSQYREDLKRSTDEVMRHAMLAAGVDSDEFLKSDGGELSNYLDELIYATVFSVSNMATRDVMHGSNQLKLVAFNTLEMMANNGLQNAIKGAAIKAIVGGSVYVGSGDKPWRSIATSWLSTRHHLITVFNETTLYVGSKSGDKYFVVRSANKQNPESDAVITVERYQQIRDKVFHPNSKALIYRR